MKNFKSGHTTGQATRSNPNASDGAVDPWVRTSIFKGEEERMRGGARVNGGVESVAKS